MSRQPAPNLVIVGHPDVPKGPAKLACSDCNEKFPASLKTALTLAQLGDKAPPVVCWGCYQYAVARNPALAHVMATNSDVIGTDAARARWGLDN